MTEMVDLYVGSQKKHFRVHKSLLCKKIRYFEKMFTGGLKECSEEIGTFPKDNPWSFDILIQWVYSESLPALTFAPNSDGDWMESFNVTDLYVLLDKICLPKLMDKLLDAAIENAAKHKFLLYLPFMDSTYAKTREGTSLRRYVLYTFHYIMNGLPRNEVTLKNWPTSSLQELTVKHPSLWKDYLEIVRNGPVGEAAKDPRLMPRCVFHQHEEDEECSLK
jgi:BTB/POZ domain